MNIYIYIRWKKEILPIYEHRLYLYSTNDWHVAKSMRWTRGASPTAGGSDGISWAAGWTCSSPAAGGTGGSSPVGGTAWCHRTIIVAPECGQPELPPKYAVRNEEQEKIRKNKKKEKKENKTHFSTTWIWREKRNEFNNI